MSRPRLVGGVLLASALCVLSANHLAKGAYYLVWAAPDGGVVNDLQTHRRENLYFLDRIWPLSQYYSHLSQFYPAMERGSSLGADPGDPHGMVWQARTVPWAFPGQFLVYPPIGEAPLRLYLFVLDSMAVALLAWFAWRQAAGEPRLTRLVMALGTTAIGAINSAETTGQNGLAINLGILGLLATWPSARPGSRFADLVFVTLLLHKPSIGAPFVVYLALQRRWMTLIPAGVAAAGSWLFASWWTGVPVLALAEQFEISTRTILGEGQNPLGQLLLASSVPGQTARNVLLIGGLAAVGLVAWRRRADADPLVAFGIVAVVARLWTYHRAYDDVLMVFLLLAVGRQMLISQRRGWWGALWLLVGCSLWPPYSMLLSEGAVAFQAAVWLTAGVALALQRPSGRDASRPWHLPLPDGHANPAIRA